MIRWSTDVRSDGVNGTFQKVELWICEWSSYDMASIDQDLKRYYHIRDSCTKYPIGVRKPPDIYYPKLLITINTQQEPICPQALE